MIRRVELRGIWALLLLGCNNAPIEPGCESEPTQIGGFETGFARCGSLVHRLEPGSCPVFDHQAPSACVSQSDPGCVVDADCDEHPFGRCDQDASGACGCTYGCAEDADCEDGFACLCGETQGRCIQAWCDRDAACADAGALCAVAPTLVCDPSAQLELACLTERDECIADSDCTEPGARCVLGHDLVRYCSLPEACLD